MKKYNVLGIQIMLDPYTYEWCERTVIKLRKYKLSDEAIVKIIELSSRAKLEFHKKAVIYAVKHVAKSSNPYLRDCELDEIKHLVF